MEQQDQRNIMLAIVLAIALYVAYSFFVIEPQQKQAREAQARAKQEQLSQNPATSPLVVRSRDQIVAADAGSRVEIAAPSVDGTISLVGSRLDDLKLRNYYETVQDKIAQRKAGEVQLLSPAETDRAFFGVVNWVAADGRPMAGFPDENSVWTQTSTGPLTDSSPLAITFESEAVKIDRKISVDADFMFTIEDTVTNKAATPVSVQPIAAMRQRLLPEHLKPSPQAHAGVIGTYGTKKSEMRKYSDLNKGKGVIEEVDAGWIGLTTKYWMGAFVPQQGEPVTMRASVDKSNGRTMFLAGYSGSTRDIAPGSSAQSTARFFAGAKQVKVLDRYEKAGIPGFTDAVDWSWLFFITKPFFWLLQTFNGWFGAFGLAILALTVVVKTVFFPVQYKMYESMSKMRKLGPETEEIRKRFASDPTRVQQEVMKMYQREKVNPLAGCLPLIPQMFVFYALYHILMVTIEMRHTPFYGWVQDMSAPDPTTIFNLFGLIPWNPGSVPFVGTFLMIGVWPLLYGLTMWLLQGLSAPPTDPMQKAIMRWMPLVFLFLFAGVAAGLAIYWTWSNLITLTQQYIIMRRQGVETELDKFLKKQFGAKAKAAE